MLFFQCLKFRSVSCLIFLVIIGNVKSGLALSVTEINARLSQHANPEITDSRFTTMVSTGGMSIVTKSHLISKGETMYWLEQKSQFQNQRIIRNGDLVKVVDINTGNSEILSLSDFGDLLPNSNVHKYLEVSRFDQPSDQGDGVFTVKQKPDSLQNIVEYTFNSIENQITKIVEITPKGDTSTTSLDFELENNISVLKEINISLKQNDNENAEIVIKYTQTDFPENISDKFFQISK